MLNGLSLNVKSGAEIWAKMAKKRPFFVNEKRPFGAKNAGPSQKPPHPFEKTWR